MDRNTKRRLPWIVCVCRSFAMISGRFQGVVVLKLGNVDGNRRIVISDPSSGFLNGGSSVHNQPGISGVISEKRCC